MGDSTGEDGLMHPYEQFLFVVIVGMTTLGVLYFVRFGMWVWRCWNAC